MPVSSPDDTALARPFLPTSDLSRSVRFYKALGFCVLLEGDVAILGIGASSIILQPYDHPEWVRHCMMQLMVDDLDAWWARLAAMDLPATFGVPAPTPPAMQPWGLRVAYVVDPTGVLWHVAERRPGHPAD